MLPLNSCFKQYFSLGEAGHVLHWPCKHHILSSEENTWRAEEYNLVL